jgi:hypothetical protein
LEDRRVDIAHIEKLVEEAYAAHAQAVIAGMKSLGRASMMSGDDSPYQDPWEEFASQIQGEESFYFDTYETVVRQFCYAQIDKMSPTERKLLWLFTEPGEEWTWDIDYDKQNGIERDPDEDEPEEATFDENDVADALYQKVCECAEDVELPSEDEDEDEEGEGDEEGEPAQPDERIVPQPAPVTLTLPLFD